MSHRFHSTEIFHLCFTFKQRALVHLMCRSSSLSFMAFLHSFHISFCLHLFYCKHFSAEIILWYARGVALYFSCIATLCVCVTYDFSNANQIKCLAKKPSAKKTSGNKQKGRLGYTVCLLVLECDKHLPWSNSSHCGLLFVRKALHLINILARCTFVSDTNLHLPLNGTAHTHVEYIIFDGLTLATILYTLANAAVAADSIFTIFSLSIHFIYRLVTWTWSFHQILSLKILHRMLLCRKAAQSNWPAGLWLFH